MPTVKNVCSSKFEMLTEQIVASAYLVHCILFPIVHNNILTLCILLTRFTCDKLGLLILLMDNYEWVGSRRHEVAHEGFLYVKNRSTESAIYLR